MERKEPFWSYATYSCLITVMNLVGVFIAAFAVMLVSAPSERLYRAVAEGGVATNLALVWASLGMGFLCGVHFRRTISAIAVPVGWVIASLLVYLGLHSEHWPDRGFPWPMLLIPLVGIPILAALSARHGSIWAAQRNRKELLWLVLMLLVFAILFWCNRELFALVPDQLRWRLWNCPL